MIYYIIPAIIIILSLAVIIFIIAKKIGNLATINIESIAEEKELTVKNRIILDRLKRKFLLVVNFINDFFNPLLDRVGQLFSNFYKKISELERMAIENKRPLKSVDDKQQLKDKLEQAEQSFDRGELLQAEDLYIEALGLSPENVEAYGGLVKVYLESRDYKKARETCKFAIKLLSKKSGVNVEVGDKKHILACFYADLGDIYQIEGKELLAEKNYQEAVSLESNNPRFLDLLLKISIMLKNKHKALEIFDSLKEADPENKKLPELRQEIDEIS